MRLSALLVGVAPVMAAAALTAALAPMPAWAARGVTLSARTAGQLGDLCGAPQSDPLNDSKIDFCHGFAQGAIDVILRQAGEKKPFCFPRLVPTRAQTMNEFVRWVRAQPAHASLPA